MVKVVVDGKEVEVPQGATLIQACEAAGAEIPRFCYHERLAIAGNCRMCLVKVDKMPKPVASCAQPATEGMVVYTNTEEVKKYREGVMEFLLINHPLDCPICDQAGECDLQDQSMFYGKGESRFDEHKRAVEDKNMGPLIKTHMTRCIQCTRCVRFIEDVAGTNELGAVNRGEDMAITTYVEKSITSELSGNIIDLCPVGALTSKPYAFKARSWELSKTESIDVLDAVGANIRIDSKGREVMRILPRLHEDINEEWLSDRARFSYDGLKYQRLDVPMMKTNGKLSQVNFEDVYQAISEIISRADKNKIGAIAGDLTDVETMTSAKMMFKSLGVKNYDCRQDGSLLDNSERSNYIFNTTIAGIEEADFCLMIGTNPRHEATLLNARLRKAQLNNKMKAALIGENVDLTFDYKHLGENPWLLKQLAEGQHPYSEQLKGHKKPIMIIGSGAMARDDYEATLYYAKKIAIKYGFITPDWNGFNILQRAASRVGGLDIGFTPEQGGLATNDMIDSGLELLFLFGADEIDFTKLNKRTKIVYVGHHGDKGAEHADFILPAAAYTEKDATFVNLEGRVQRARLAVYPPNEAKPDWQIINELAEACGVKLGLDSLAKVRAKMVEMNSLFATHDVVSKAKISQELGKMKDFRDDKFVNPIKNYYQTNSISRASKTMAECVRDILETKAA